MTCNHVYTLHNVSKLLLKKLGLTADVEKDKSRYSIAYTYNCALKICPQYYLMLFRFQEVQHQLSEINEIAACLRLENE